MSASPDRNGMREKKKERERGLMMRRDLTKSERVNGLEGVRGRVRGL